MRFEVTPFSEISTIGRFRVIEVEPEIRLYLSPLNYDPADPAIRLTEPYEYSAELHAALGDHKTVGWDHETWGLNEERIAVLVIESDFVFDEVFQHTEPLEFLGGQHQVSTAHPLPLTRLPPAEAH